MEYRKPLDIELAFAICIVKRKPPRTTYERFFYDLRQNSREGPRRTHTSHHLDAAEFWKARYEQAEVQNTRLRAQTVLLNKELSSVHESSKEHKKPCRKSRARSTGLDAVIETNLASVQTLLDQTGKAVMESLCLLHFAPDAQSGLESMAVLQQSLYRFFSVRDMPFCNAKHWGLIMQLLQTIYKGYRNRIIMDSASDQAMTRIVCELLVSLLPLMRIHTMALHNTTTLEQTVLSPGEVRTGILSTTMFFLKESQNHAVLHVLFRALVGNLKGCLIAWNSNSSDHTRAIEREIANFFLVLLESYNTYEDVDRYYEQQLVRLYQETGPLEYDIWTLGVLKNWIRFD